MKPCRLYVFALLLCVIPSLRCQSSHANKGSAAATFHWDSRNIEELDAQDAIGQLHSISPSERNSLVAMIAAQLKVGDDEGRSNEDGRKIASQTRVKLVDLNSDGVEEIIAQAVGQESGCSPTGNCPIWVFQRSGQTYKILLEAESIQTFTIQPERTNQFQDLVLGMHGSAFEQELHVYQFQQGKYRLSRCYDARWKRLVNGEWQPTKEPLIKPCSR